MKRWIHATSWPYKVKYEVHAISRDGNAVLLGGSNDIEEANRIARDQAQEYYESPWESDENKFKWLESIYIVDVKNEDSDMMNLDTEDYIDSLMSELDGRIKWRRSKKIGASSNYDSMINNEGENFRQFLDRTRWEGFDPSSLSEDEYYELEDEFYGIEKFGREDFDKWWATLDDAEMDEVVDIIEDMGLPLHEKDWPYPAFLEIRDRFQAIH